MMPESSPEPKLRPSVSGRYMSSRYEREYASLSEQLEALDHDIDTARKASQPPKPPLRRSRRHDPEPPPHGEPATLPDGTRLLVRPIEPADAPRLRAAFEHLDAVSRYRRFLTIFEHLSVDQLDYLTHVDHVTHDALVALDAADGKGVGIARFVRDARDPSHAAVAVVVAAERRNHGVATFLAERLAARAAAVGVEFLDARMLAGDHVARALLEHIATDIREREDGGTIVLTGRLRPRT